MPGPIPSPSAPVSRGAEIQVSLRRLLEEYHAGAYRLPSLRPERSFLSEWLSGWMDALRRWIARWWGESGQALDPGIKAFLERIALIFTDFVLVLLVLSFFAFWLIRLAKYFGARADAPSESGPPPGAAVPAEQSLAARIDLALSQGEVARAARVRWRLHLLRSGLPASITPFERLGPSSPRFDELMFGASPGSEIAAYRTLDEELRRAEREGTLHA